MGSAIATFLIAAASPAVQGPAPIAQADICSVIEQSVTRLGEDIGDKAEVEQAGRLAETLERPVVISVKQRRLRYRGSWGRCRVTVPPGSFVSKLDDLRFSRTGDFAMTSGGWIAAPLMGSGGECFFRKTAAGWTLIGCRNTWAV